MNFMTHKRTSMIDAHFQSMRKISNLPYDEYLKKIADVLKEGLNCESVCILFWSEREQKLVTKYSSGLPEELSKPERYENTTGITGDYIFSKGRWIRALLNSKEEQIFDQILNKFVQNDTTKWHNIKIFEKHSRFGKFKSLLGVPFFVQNQEPGVVKLINKISSKDETELEEKGFNNEDVELMKSYLSLIEYFVGTKRNEKLLSDVIEISQTVTNTQFKYEQILEEIVKSCADILNCKICLIRFQENNKLIVKASNIDGLKSANPIPSSYTFAQLSRVKRPIQGRVFFDENKVIYDITNDKTSSNLSGKEAKMVAPLVLIHKVDSFLIVPILHQEKVIGSIECYTCLPREFSDQEIRLVDFYSNSLTIRERLKENIYINQIIDEIASIETVEGIIDLILSESLNHFGFDFGVISLVDNRNQSIRTVSDATNKPDLVNPSNWREQASYKLKDDKDILIEVVTNKKVIFVKGWHESLNKKIYEEHHHKNLVRMFVPFIPKRNLGEKDLQNPALGVIEVGFHISNQNHISNSLVDSFVNFINYCADSFQRVILLEEKKNAEKILEGINLREHQTDSFLGVEKIYEELIDFIDQFKQNKGVCIWEKKAVLDSFHLSRKKCSSNLEEIYNHKRVTKTLQKGSHVFDYISSNNLEITYIEDKEIEKNLEAFPELVDELRSSSMIIVPIIANGDIFGAITILVENHRNFPTNNSAYLTVEESALISVVANKAVSRIQGAKLIKGFVEFSEFLLNKGVFREEDEIFALQSITDNAIEVLNANPVVLYRYSTKRRQFLSELITSGEFYSDKFTKPVGEIRTGEWVNVIHHKGEDVFIANKEEYIQKKNEWNIQRLGDRFKDDFWEREKINSFAGVILKHNDETVGAMFFNYRKPIIFTESIKQLVKAFAKQAALAITLYKLSTQNITWWEIQKKNSFFVSNSEVVNGVMHNFGHLLLNATGPFENIKDLLLGADKITGDDLIELKSNVDKFENAFDKIIKDHDNIRTFQRSEPFNLQLFDLEMIVREAISLVKNQLDKKNIKVQERYESLPKVRCDKKQIQHLLLNLILNSYDAMGHRGKLFIATSRFDEDFAEIQITDDGRGISEKDKEEIFTPLFTTKANGTGLGLPISRYIAKQHGGSIELFTKKRPQETTFKVRLPINTEVRS